MNDYSSLRFEINGELRQDINSWGLDYIDEQDVFSNPDYPYLGREENTHCTVLYNIVDTEPEQAQKVLTGEPSFNVELGELSVFENDMFDVIKINVSGQGLDDLHEVASSEIDHDELYHKFNPHVTIAFLKKYKGTRLLERVNKRKFVGIKLKVNKLLFNKYRKDETVINLAT